MNFNFTTQSGLESTQSLPDSFSELSAGKREKRLARNQRTREANQAKLAENETKQRKPMTTQVMKPRG